MIIKSYEAKKINLDKNPFVLLYGKNDGLKNQIKNKILENKTITSNYEEKEILDNSKNFIEDLYSKSLFENEKLITINRVTDKLFKILFEIIEKKIEGLIIIINADNLEKRSKIRTLFEKNNNCICVPIYPDTEITLAKLALEYLKQKNISISNSNLNLIVSKCNGDRKILLMELEKVEYYNKNGKKITSESIAKLINLIENHNISELVDNCLAKNKSKTINILVENNFNNEDCILIIRILLNKLKKILKLSSKFQENKNLELTISSAKPPIFWKDKEITKQQIYKWTPESIRKLIYSLNEIELLVKKNINNSINLITDFILDQSSSNTNN